MNVPNILRLLFIGLFFPMVATAQITTTIPLKSTTNVLPRQTIEALQIEPLDLKAIEVEDAKTINSNRFAVPVKSNFDLKQVASKVALEDGTLYRYEVSIPNAKGLFATFSNFNLPIGAHLHVYDPSVEQVLGAYTSTNNKQSRTFMVGEVKGESMLFEYFEPTGKNGSLIVDGFYASYKRSVYPVGPGVQGKSGANFGESDDCNVDVNCQQSTIVQQAKRSSVRILMAFTNGLGNCSGTVLNNARQDKTPFLLTAFHCVDGFQPRYDLWRFDFNYEKLTCLSENEPGFNSVIGCEQRSGFRDSDFLLLEISQSIPDNYRVRYAGWDVSDNPTIDSAFIIHHPQGDVKKLSIYNEVPVIYQLGITWDNGTRTPPQHHFNGFFKNGTFEPGSSGAALFNESGQVIGQLHGGNGTCQLPLEIESFCGRLAVSYQGRSQTEQLIDFLDPDGTGIQNIGSIEAADANFSFAGNVKKPNGEPLDSMLVKRYLIANADTTLLDSVYSNTQGAFTYSLAESETYFFTFSKQDEVLNGLSLTDLNILQQILLERTEATNATHLASDINKDGIISLSDLNQFQLVLLSRSDALPNSWLFYDPNTFRESAPFFNSQIRSFSLRPVSNVAVELIGIKSGDLNFSGE